MKHAADTLQFFLGAFNLSNPLGTNYLTHTQTGALTLSAAGNKEINGWATVPIVANGDAITPDAEWVKFGGDDLDLTAGVTNHFVLTWTGEFFYWSNKVVTP